MKKIIFAVILGSLMIGCSEPKESKREQDYIEKLEESYEGVREEYPEAKLKSVSCIISGDIGTLGDTIKVIDFEEFYELQDGCIVVLPDTTQLLKGRKSGGQQDILPGELEMTLHDAVEILRQANFILPKSQTLTIQKPAGFVHPLYVFGSGYDGWFAVDMRTKKIYKVHTDFSMFN